MTCDEARGAIEAFIEADLPEAVGIELMDHLESCPACAIEYEELRELIGSLRHARSAVRPLHPFDVASLPTTKPRRRPRLLLAAAAIVGVWTVFCTSALLWPSLGARVTFLQVGGAAGSASTKTANDKGLAMISLSKVPTAALQKALTSLASKERLVQGSSPYPGGFAPNDRTSVRVARIGPVVEQGANSLQLYATLDVAEGPGSTASIRQVQVLVTLSRRSNGSWATTRMVTSAP